MLLHTAKSTLTDAAHGERKTKWLLLLVLLLGLLVLKPGVAGFIAVGIGVGVAIAVGVADLFIWLMPLLLLSLLGWFVCLLVVAVVFCLLFLFVCCYCCWCC